MDFTGEFETHITVYVDDSKSLEALKRWSIGHGLKCLHIILERGIVPSQPMLTRGGHGRLSDELATALELGKSLKSDGFQITRIKIEASPLNNDIPQSNADVSQHDSDIYFEHHVKLLLEPQADNVALAKIAERHSAHLSHNALRIREDGRREWFVTQRCPSVGHIEARQQLDSLLNAISEAGYQAISIKEEFVVYDSNMAIDDGWIQA